MNRRKSLEIYEATIGRELCERARRVLGKESAYDGRVTRNGFDMSGIYNSSSYQNEEPFRLYVEGGAEESLVAALTGAILDRKVDPRDIRIVGETSLDASGIMPQVSL